MSDKSTNHVQFRARFGGNFDYFCQELSVYSELSFVCESKRIVSADCEADSAENERQEYFNLFLFHVLTHHRVRVCLTTFLFIVHLK